MKANPLVKIFLVDDHPMFRMGLIEAIARDAALSIVGEAGSGEEALLAMERTSVDVVVVDVTLPGMDGLELSKRLLRRRSPPGVVLLTMHNSEKIFNMALDLGIRAYILKDEMVGGIVEAIRRAAAGEAYVSPALSSYVMRRGRQRNRMLEEVPALTSLTVSERSILKLIAEDKSSKEIAAQLFISLRTVGTHRNNISTKLGVSGSHGLLRFALVNKSEILSLPG